MNTGIFSWFGYVMPIEERIRLIKEAGFDSVMLWWEDEDYPKFIDKMKFVELATSHGLMIDNIHLPYEDSNLIWSENETERNAYIDKTMTWLDGCKCSGASKVVMHTHRNSIKDVNYTKGYDSFDRIIRFAENIKISIAIENTIRFDYTEFLLKEFSSPYLGFCYDSSHDFINGQSQGQILKKWKDRLFCVHLSDTDGITDRHWLPLKGKVDFNEILKQIKMSSCDTLSMEVYPFEEEKKLTPKEFLDIAHERIKDLGFRIERSTNLYS